MALGYHNRRIHIELAHSQTCAKFVQLWNMDLFNIGVYESYCQNTEITETCTIGPLSAKSSLTFFN